MVNVKRYTVFATKVRGNFYPVLCSGTHGVHSFLFLLLRKRKSKYVSFSFLIGHADGSTSNWGHLPEIVCPEWGPEWHQRVLRPPDTPDQLPGGAEGQEWDHGHRGILEPIPGRSQPRQGPKRSHSHCHPHLQGTDRHWPGRVHDLVMLRTSFKAVSMALCSCVRCACVWTEPGVTEWRAARR